VHYAMLYEDGHLSVLKDGRPAADRKLGRHWWSNGREIPTGLVGAMDDIRVYDRALKPEQIEGLHGKDSAEISANWDHLPILSNSGISLLRHRAPTRMLSPCDDRTC